MGLFKKKIGPVFLKEDSDVTSFISKMETLRDKANDAIKKEIDTQIALARYGQVGESNVAYELKSSGMDMFILHDICLETDSLSAQIDYLVITRKKVYVIECKNLIGNIEIDNAGNFIRTYELFGKRKKEGIYSPITQNQRHLRVIKEIGLANKKNIVTKKLFENAFDENYISLVVLANPKTYLNAKYAKKEIKEQVIRADQLIARIKQLDDGADAAEKSEKEMQELANFFLDNNHSDHSDYSRKYEKMVTELNGNHVEEGVQKGDTIIEDETKITKLEADISEEIKSRLKAWRLAKSKSEGIKPYYIFNDAQMIELIKKNPQTKEELVEVSGFGKVKAEKYGDEILNILKS